MLDLNDAEAQNPKLCAPRGSCLALLTQITREKARKPRTERLLNALLSVPVGNKVKRRSFDARLDVIPEDEGEDSLDFKEYVQCPDFVPPNGCIVTSSGFIEAIKSNQNLKELIHELNISKTDKIAEKLKK